MKVKVEGLPVRRLSAIVGLLLVGLTTAACDPEEQGRVLQYEKGTYLGQADEALSDETRRELRTRAQLQYGM